MARMRIVKPEFWTSSQVVECSTNARLLFIGMWNFCDDAGIHPHNIKRLKMEVFPGDDFTEEQIRGMVNELIAAELLLNYEAEGKEWLIVTGWHHQKIDKPNYRYPKPDSTNTSRTVGEQSETIHPRIGIGREGNSNGEEGNGLHAATPQNPPKTHKDIEIPANLNTPECHKAIDDWLEYKRKMRHGYKSPTFLSNLLENEFSRAGPAFFVESVQFCINQGYQGLFPKKGGNGGRRSGPQNGPGQSYDPNSGEGKF